MESQQRDEALWQLAKKRAGFKQHLATYVIINLFLWGIWWFTAGQHHISTGPVAWPAWVTLGWGLGLAFSYMGAYGDGDMKSSTQKEYEKLKRSKNEGQQS
jgi:hypothetical protein